jgi:hypothetical protein
LRRRRRHQEDPGDRIEDVLRKRRHWEDPSDRRRYFKEKKKTLGRPW